ncbi:hypothetical protein [Treponema sp.]|uniref:ComF family protein n=1 Tax=Treponema sp. TaxID=166 RepID=UPI00298DADA8|nr:hypothetical protein [Treponema sp.]MCQ2241326.1 hypothetical protein [Treponema sp.]
MLVKGIYFRLKNVLRTGFNWAYGGGTCLVCGSETFLGEVCKKCKDNLLLNYCDCHEKEIRCSVCGKVLLSEEGTCMACRNERIIKSCDSVFPILPYRLWGKTLMFHWKMLEKRGISFLVAEMCSKVLASRFGCGSKNLVPVPPRPGKIRKKGWDQIEEVCSILEGVYGHKVLKLLKRNASIQQKKLDRKHRLDGSAERYGLSGKGINIKRENLPKRVILIDDVMTTGITVESCAKVLKSLGIEKVDVLTVFIVD